MKKTSVKKSTQKPVATKPAFAPVDAKQPLPQIEHEMLKFWEENGIFEKSVDQRRGPDPSGKQGEKFVFFDGPPFANGLPHYGHILANALKDAVTRYWTMKGFYVPRVNGWDCHGLPVEYEIEKELKLSGRKDIEKMGVAKFNSECRKSVFKYTEEWEKLLKRIARWVDFENGYATLDNNYMESIWWVFKEIWKKDLMYQGYKPMHICPRCETSLSNFEVTLGYKEVVDLSVTVRFLLCDEPNTYFLAWTTTPWSMLSTMGLAIGPDFDYVQVETEDGSKYYLAEARVEAIFTDVGSYKILKKLKGKELVHKKYTHFFPYYDNAPEVKKSKYAFHTVPADYVSTEDGTGIVTINGAFGEIDFESAKKHALPIFVNVGTDGRFLPETGEFAGMSTKEAERKVVEYLTKNNALFRKDPLKHSYPHCWRCDTPLLNYATKSWFVRVTDVKEKLLKNNKKIHWVPDHIQEGRFGKWLENARDWNISRNRFWGCPMPIWECACGNQECVGSVHELRERSTGGNTFIFVRHGEADHNILGIISDDPQNRYNLTKKGRGQVEEVAQKLSKRGVDMIFSSPVLRTQQTAEIISKELGVEFQIDQHLHEHTFGDLEGADNETYKKFYTNLDERYHKKLPGGGESFEEVEKRIALFIDYLNRSYSGKTIVLVSHAGMLRAAMHLYQGKSIEETFTGLPPNASTVEFYAGKLPQRNGELDLHKPYIDEITFPCTKCGAEMKRIPEVLDCWFESGSMPYAQLHYPFENKKEFEENFPANFIAEGVDQTRGWFYTLHVLATILFDKPAFKNVIVNGILLAADGEKLSKRKKNYPDPTALFELHGVDTTRLFLYTSTAPLAEDVRFSEKHVEDLVKKFTLTLWNTYSFFVTYANIDCWKPKKAVDAGDKKSANKLDQWIISELHTLIAEMTQQMDAYNLTKATRPLLTFIDNLSNWYVRRSRRRFWKSENDGDKNNAYQTLHTVLATLSKLLAPFMPATAEAIYKNLTGDAHTTTSHNAVRSVHLEDWPKANKFLIQSELNEEMKVVRTIVSLALRIRGKKNVKVRQPLAEVSVALPAHIKKITIESYRDVIREEINVKELSFVEEGSIATKALRVDSRKIGPRFGGETQIIIALSKKGDFAIQKNGEVVLPAKDKKQFTLHADEYTMGYMGSPGHDVESENGILVSLDTTVSGELKKEGLIRDLIRTVQELRKKANYDIADRIYLFIKASPIIQEAVTLFADLIEKETLALEIQEGGDFEWDAEEEVEIEGEKIRVGVRKGV